MWQTDYLKLAILTSCFKVLFFPAYRSTDFEVHRNWLAITHSLPVSAWYKNTEEHTNTTSNTNIEQSANLHKPIYSKNLENSVNEEHIFSKSEWTLDYPPLFAFMEFLLAQVAYYFDDAMLNIHNLNYASWQTVTFQRLSVVFTDVVFLLAVYGFAKYFSKNPPGQDTILKSGKSSKNICKETPKKPENIQDNIKSSMIISLLFLTNSTLFIVDHIHFQYNGILFGILLLSILRIYQARIPESALLFSILLCMKHIYLYIASVYGVYMLKNHCVSYKDGLFDKGSFIKRLFQLGFIVLVVFSITFLPFILIGQLPDLLSRLFPFHRGLSHAYWAPNFWALYNSVDKLTLALGGRVQEFKHHLLPSIKPVHTLALSVLFMLPSLRLAWKQTEGHVSFLRAAILCAFTSFLFGWHVHEKAILIVTIPLTILSLYSQKDAGIYLMLHSISSLSILPLLFQQQEQLVKYCLSLFSVLVAFVSLQCYHKPRTSSKRFQLPFMTSLESLYVIGLPLVEAYTSLVHPLVFKSKLPFLPLLLTSLYCSLGVMYSYIRMLFHYK